MLSMILKYIKHVLHKLTLRKIKDEASVHFSPKFDSAATSFCTELYNNRLSKFSASYPSGTQSSPAQIVSLS